MFVSYPVLMPSLSAAWRHRMENPKKPLFKAGEPRPHRPSLLLANGLVPPLQPALIECGHPPLRFAIKRHCAINLHTDYRLEIGDALFSLVSWGHPSFDPSRPVRLREMPDHDPAYLLGERRIPDGQYGAGPMVVWDFGHYRATLPFVGSPPKAVLAALLGGRLDFEFDGRRMKGAFRLEIADQGWRLVKMRDAFASLDRIEWDNRSIVTGKSLDDIERQYQATRRR